MFCLQVHKYEDRTLPTDILPCGNTAFPLKLHAGSYPTVPPQYIECNSLFPLTFDEARKLERETVKQAESDGWFKARENRLTASNFHRIEKRKKEVDDKFVASILSAPKSLPVTACSYGSAQESNAKIKYCQLNPPGHLHDCGLVVNPHLSFLGATPDAKVCCKGVTGILEIKCPYTARDMSINQAVAQVTGFCLTETDGKVELKRKHNYYCQVQGQLLVTGAPFCDFVVYTQCDVHIETIFADRDFQNQMMEKLASFYYRYALPYLRRKSVWLLRNIQAVFPSCWKPVVSNTWSKSKLAELFIDVAAAAHGWTVSGSVLWVAQLFPFLHGILLQDIMPSSVVYSCSYTHTHTRTHTIYTL